MGGSTFDFICLLSQSTALLGYETGSRSPLMPGGAAPRREIDRFSTNSRDPLGDTDFAVRRRRARPPLSPRPNRANAWRRRRVRGAAISELSFPAARASGWLRFQIHLVGHPRWRSPASRRVRAQARPPWPPVHRQRRARAAVGRRFRNSFMPRAQAMCFPTAPVCQDYGPSRGISYGSLCNQSVQTPLLLWRQFGGRRRPGGIGDLAPPRAVWCPSAIVRRQTRAGRGGIRGALQSGAAASSANFAAPGAGGLRRLAYGVEFASQVNLNFHWRADPGPLREPMESNPPHDETEAGMIAPWPQTSGHAFVWKSCRTRRCRPSSPTSSAMGSPTVDCPCARRPPGTCQLWV